MHQKSISLLFIFRCQIGPPFDTSNLGCIGSQFYCYRYSGLTGPPFDTPNPVASKTNMSTIDIVCLTGPPFDTSKLVYVSPSTLTTRPLWLGRIFPNDVAQRLCGNKSARLSTWCHAVRAAHSLTTRCTGPSPRCIYKTNGFAHAGVLPNDEGST